jgi:nitrous oxide reductase accessory protein NosL
MKIAGRIFWASILLLSVLSSFVAAESDIEAQRSCSYCGMDRKAYGYSRMVVVYEGGAKVGTCSLHCTVTELKENGGRKVKALLVADRDTRKLIPAESAIWVMGGRKKGVMTQRPKWAFATQAGAAAFIAANGGVLTGWQSVLAAAVEDAELQSRRR